MNDTNNKSTLNILIIGYGFLGKEIFQQITQHKHNIFNKKIRIFTVSKSSTDKQSSYIFKKSNSCIKHKHIYCDISNYNEVKNKFSKLPKIDFLIFCPSSSRGKPDSYRNIFVNGLKFCIKIISPDYLLFTSSTSVYHQTNGQIVDENSRTKPSKIYGQILLEAENIALNYKIKTISKFSLLNIYNFLSLFLTKSKLNTSTHSSVVRLSGLYSILHPERSFILNNFFIKKNPYFLKNNSSKFVNQIHIHDAASAILYICFQKKNGVFNITDNHSMTQKEIYNKLYQLFHKYKMHKINATNIKKNDILKLKRGWTNKIVSNKKIRQMGWSCKYPDFFFAINKHMSFIKEKFTLKSK